MTYHETSGPVLACDECGCAVPATERDRALHNRFHEERQAIVVDLTKAREKIDLTAGEVEELRRTG